MAKLDTTENWAQGRPSWNQGKPIDPTLPNGLRQVWARRAHLELACRLQDHALVSFAFDSTCKDATT